MKTPLCLRLRLRHLLYARTGADRVGERRRRGSSRWLRHLLYARTGADRVGERRISPIPRPSPEPGSPCESAARPGRCFERCEKRRGVSSKRASPKPPPARGVVHRKVGRLPPNPRKLGPGRRRLRRSSSRSNMLNICGWLVFAKRLLRRRRKASEAAGAPGAKPARPQAHRA